MKTDLSELLASFPEEEGPGGVLDSIDVQEQLREIFADLSYRPVPVHSLQRLWTISELSTQIALAYTGQWLRGLFADTETKQRHAGETNIRVALKMIHRLGYLRGAATKLGQALGSLPELLPEQVVQALDMLHTQAPPMHFSLLREVVKNELGKDPEAAFASFDKEPFAAASIGQVHRARLKTGEDVAVKIQYPGIGRAIQADLRNLMALIFPMRLTKGGQSIKGQCEAIRDMLAQEIDYFHEAQNMREAYSLFEAADEIVVPRVFDDYCTARVLTAEYVPGQSLNDFLATNPSQQQRDNFGSKISRAWFRMHFANASYSDPHSGNYVFMNDGRLGLLDFGCIQRFSEDDFRILAIGEQYMDKQISLEELLRKTGFEESEIASETFVAPLRRHQDWLVAPVHRGGVFDFSDAVYFRQGIDSLKEMVQKRYPAPPMYVYVFRSLFGLRILSWRLQCRVDIAALRAQEKQRIKRS